MQVEYNSNYIEDNYLPLVPDWTPQSMFGSGIKSYKQLASILSSGKRYKRFSSLLNLCNKTAEEEDGKPCVTMITFEKLSRQTWLSFKEIFL